MEERYKIILLSENPDLKHSTDEKFKECWDEFMLCDEVSIKYREFRDKEFSDYHFYVVDNHRNVLAMCKSIPTHWNGSEESLPEGYDDALIYAINYYKTKGKSNWNTLLGTSICVFKENRNLGLSSFCVNAMKQICRNNGFQNLIIPVRPNFKHKYPLIEIDEYIKWTNSDERSFDPWVRTHLNIGGKIIRVAKKSMTIKGSIDEWEKWTKMQFLSTGKYIVAGALSPIEINYEEKTGVYYDPNVWIVHSIDMEK